LFKQFKGCFGIKLHVIYSLPKAIITPSEITKNSTIRITTIKQKSGHKYEKSGLIDLISSEIYSNLNSLMNEHSDYKNEELTLVKLPNRLDVNPNHLSQIINEKQGKNFYIYISSLKVQKFINPASLPENKNSQRLLWITI
tara:strand:+ start:24112 stop:24534 length:423 start_codon:yes stop_codon:yes gene_type:complete